MREIFPFLLQTLAFFCGGEYNECNRVITVRKVPPNGTLSVDERGECRCGIVVRPLQNEISMYALSHFVGVCGPLFQEVFIMQKTKNNWWQRLLFSETLIDKSRSQKIAYIAVMTAFCVVANMFFEFKFADVQFSLTIFISALTGILIGAGFGFAACFLGDLVGFLYNNAGLMYMPWIGLSMAITAFLAGLFFSVIKGNGRTWFVYVKLAAVCVSVFFLCTVLINTTAFWFLYSKVDYMTYLVSRLFIQGQIWNSLVNYALLFMAVPILNRVKPLKLQIQ